MTLRTYSGPNSPSGRPLVLAGIGLVIAAATLSILLSLAVKNNPSIPSDASVMSWVSGWRLPGLRGAFVAISILTDNWPAMGFSAAGVSALWLLGMSREAKAVTIFGGVAALAIFLTDYSLGSLVYRSRPLADATGYSSFPSGHVFGSTVFYGFIAYLVVRYRPKQRLTAIVVTALVLLIVLAGLSRIYLEAHWPSDVAAGYLLGFFWLIVIIGAFGLVKKLTLRSSLSLPEDLSALSCERCRVARSLASVVLLDPERGSATKAYAPPPVVRLLYWVSFQARFPYERNSKALEAAVHRRKIASLLTVHRFGKDLVARATGVNCAHGKCTFVTEFIPGERAANNDVTRDFLGRLSTSFAEAGLSIWQVNPRNPHAHTNLIRTPDGDLKVIDLESAVVSLLPAPGQWRSALKAGRIPIFDDIDFGRLRKFVSANAASLQASLTEAGLAELNDSIDRCQQAINEWKGSEPRVWGRIIGAVYRLLDWKAFFGHLRHALDGASDPHGGQ